MRYDAKNYTRELCGPDADIAEIRRLRDRNKRKVPAVPRQECPEAFLNWIEA